MDQAVMWTSNELTGTNAGRQEVEWEKKSKKRNSNLGKQGEVN